MNKMTYIFTFLFFQQIALSQTDKLYFDSEIDYFPSAQIINFEDSIPGCQFANLQGMAISIDTGATRTKVMYDGEFIELLKGFISCYFNKETSVKRLNGAMVQIMSGDPMFAQPQILYLARIAIDNKGKLLNLTVRARNNSPLTDLSDHLKHQLEQVTFLPALKDGKPISCQLYYGVY